MKKLCVLALASSLVFNLNAQNKNTVRTQPTSISEISNPSSFTITNKYIWLPKLVSLPTQISYDIKFNDKRDEFIPVYSYNKIKWGNNNPAPDALSWYLSPQSNDFTFRTGLFKSNPYVQRGEKIKVEIGRLYNIRCVIDESSAIYYVDDKLYAMAIYDIGTVPKKGYFGFAVWGIANINVMNIKLVSGYSSHVEESNSIGQNLNVQREDSNYNEHYEQLQAYNPQEVMELKDLLYKKKDTTLITGKVIDYDINEKIRIEVNYKEGKPEGLTKSWYENGQLQLETNIKGGEPDGIIRGWYANGQLEKEVNFINGVQEGLLKEWYENGQLEREIHFIEGEQHGLFREWYENGYQKIEQPFNNGKPEGLCKEWYENGQLKQEASIIKGIQEGVFKEWHENGELKAEQLFKMGKPEGRSRYWYDNGVLSKEQFFEEGQATGINREWHDNSQLKQEVNIIKGLPEGLYRDWYENGQLEREALLINGQPEGLAKEYYENGQLKRKGNYNNGKKNGIYTFYNEDGTIHKKENWQKGVLKSD